MIREIIYLDRDNTIDLLLKSDRVAQDLSAVTRMIIKEVNGEFSIDSNSYGSAFDWDTEVTGKLILDLAAALESENVDEGIYLVYLIIFDSVNQDGIVWDSWILDVKASP